MPGRDADALARDLIETRGFGDAFGHSLGHGLGLEVHEAPRLSKMTAEPLPLDAVVTIEPGVYLAGEGGVRIEDDVHLSREGPVLLTDGRTELVEQGVVGLQGWEVEHPAVPSTCGHRRIDPLGGEAVVAQMDGTLDSQAQPPASVSTAVLRSFANMCSCRSTRRSCTPMSTPSTRRWSNVTIRGCAGGR